MIIMRYTRLQLSQSANLAGSQRVGPAKRAGSILLFHLQRGALLT